jgi:hypothetical protein
MSGQVRPLPVLLTQLTFPYTASSDSLFTHINNTSELYIFVTDLTVPGEKEVACKTSLVLRLVTHIEKTSPSCEVATLETRFPVLQFLRIQ